MVIRRSPALTSAPSRKCTACTAPATRERTSTRSTASRRPENSSQTVTSLSATAATDTGVGGGAPASAALLALLPPVANIAETTAAIAVTEPTAAQSLRWRTGLLLLSVVMVSSFERSFRAKRGQGVELSCRHQGQCSGLRRDQVVGAGAG